MIESCWFKVARSDRREIPDTHHPEILALRDRITATRTAIRDCYHAADELAERRRKADSALSDLRNKVVYWFRALPADQRQDPLILALRTSFEADHVSVVAEQSPPLLARIYKLQAERIGLEKRLDSLREQLLDPILRVFKLYGIRMVSITDRSLVSFEDINFPAPWPAIWAAARAMGISDGCGNANQCQVTLRGQLPDSAWGTYDLRGKSPKRVADAISYANTETEKPLKRGKLPDFSLCGETCLPPQGKRAG
jgi:hypothetical protein